MAASCATRGSSTRRASSTWATSWMRMSRREATSSGGTISVAMNMPPPAPRRTSISPESTRTLIASRSVGREISICSASARSDGRRSPTASSPSLTFSAICPTASSKVRRVWTGVNMPAGKYGGMTLHHESHGPADGEVALCVHGLSANLRSFDHIGAALTERGLRVIAMDLRGRGATPDSGAGTYGIDSHVDDLLALAPERFHYVGWSMGAFIGLRMADRAPERLLSLTLIDAAGATDPRAIELIRAGLARLDTDIPEDDYVAAIRERGLLEPWSDLWDAYLRYEHGRTSRAACEEDLDRGLEADPELWWPAARMPTLLVRGTRPMGEGLIVPEDVRDRLVAALPDLRVVEVDANHYGVADDPAAIAAIADFVAQPR